MKSCIFWDVTPWRVLSPVIYRCFYYPGWYMGDDERIWKEASMVQSTPGIFLEWLRKTSHDSRCPDRDSNQIPPKCMPTALPTDQPVRCNLVQSGKIQPRFRRNISLRSWGPKSKPNDKPALSSLCLLPEDGGYMLLRNVGLFSSDSIALYPRR
jgi:hypothetical protein